MTRDHATPRLEPGDRLSRAEFERRYRAMPSCKKAELVEGIVYMLSPVRHARHGVPHATLAAWMGTYALATPGVECADNATVRLDLDNEPQPDLLLRVAEACGGSSRLDAEGYLAGAPELVAEVAASSASYDLHDKLHVYRRSGVREYLVWRVDDQEVDWFMLRGSSYHVLPRESGVVRSERFPGLWLGVPALLGGDGSALLRVLDEGLASTEHAALVARLAGSRR